MNLGKPSLRQKIFDVLRDKIVFMVYPPGMSLSEKDLCKEYKVSCTPLREAIRRLEEMKLVSVLPRYGTFVSHIDLNEIRCAFEVKIELEYMVGRLAAERITTDKLEELQALIKQAEILLNENRHENLIEIDTKFHKVIYQSAQNPVLAEILESLQYRCARLWSSTFREKIARPELVDELCQIYSSLRERDCEKRACLLENHVRNSVEVIKNRLL
jgi:DNA-binding GntR family transcriptional regulator